MTLAEDQTAPSFRTLPESFSSTVLETMEGPMQGPLWSCSSLELEFRLCFGSYKWGACILGGGYFGLYICDLK